MMKIQVIIVGIIFITGSQANDYAEASTPNITVDVLIEQAEALVKNMPFAIGWSFIRIFDTKTGHALYDILENITRRFDHFDEELPPELKETFDLVASVLSGISRKVSNTLHELERKKAITGPLKPILSHYLEPVVERMNPQIRAFVETVAGWVTGFIEVYNIRLPEQIRSLEDGFSFYIEYLEDAKATLQPTIDEAMTRLRQGLEALNKNFKPHLKRFLEESREYKEEFKQWVNTPIFHRDP